MAKQKKECSYRSTLPQEENIYMRWLATYMSRSGLGVKDIALRTDIKAPTMYHWLQVDDCSLSSAIHLMNDLGYDLIVDLEDQKTEEDDNIKADFVSLEYTDDYGKEMLFLRRAIHAHGYTPSTLAEAMNAKGYTLTKAAVAKYFYGIGDIRMSRLYQFAEAMGTKVVIKMLPKK